MAEILRQERIRNPFADTDSISEQEVANAHAMYFPEFTTPDLDLDPDFGFGHRFGPSRASNEDVLGLDERLRRGDVRASVVTISETGRGPVPIVNIQAPSTEGGHSLLSSEADPRERIQSPDEENLFYGGGPRSFAGAND